MDVIANNLPQFQGDIGGFQNSLTALQGSFDQLISQMNGLQAMWEGEAHEELQNSFIADRERMQALLEFFREYKSDLDFAHSEYSDCEKTVAALIQGMNI